MSVKSLFRELVDSNETDISMTDKQISIISAAIEIFAEKGYAATSTSEIAKKAGVGEGTIFHHYKTKKDLLLAVPEYLNMLSFSKAFPDNISKIFEKPYENFEDFLIDVIRNRKRFIEKNMMFIKVLFQEIPFHPELRTKISQSILIPATDKLSKVLDRYKEKGQIIDIPNASIVNLMFSSVFGYFFTNYIIGFGLKVDSEKETEYLIQYIMNGVGKNS
ncbi:MAG: TetR/AcrR family transcriptional regulator [Deltaproteobacteria bacterium]